VGLSFSFECREGGVVLVGVLLPEEFRLLDVDENRARAFPYLQQRSRPPAPLGEALWPGLCV
jgi:hypothetical protein